MTGDGDTGDGGGSDPLVIPGGGGFGSPVETVANAAASLYGRLLSRRAPRSVTPATSDAEDVADDGGADGARNTEYDEIATSRGYDEVPRPRDPREGEHRSRQLPPQGSRAGHREVQGVWSQCLDERARLLVQSNLQIITRWILCARIRSVAVRIVSAAGDEVRKKEWRTTEDPVEPATLVHEVFSDKLTTQEDAVFGLNDSARTAAIICRPHRTPWRIPFDSAEIRFIYIFL